MPAHRLVPDPTTLRRWLEEGLTHQQIADRQYKETGNKITRASVSSAVSRLGMSEQAPRYTEEIPWRVKVQHIRAYPARMLRLLGRRRAGGELTSEENTRLDNWLQLLEDEDAVVAYDPDSDAGFLYVPRQKGDGRAVPIRKERVYLHP